MSGKGETQRVARYHLSPTIPPAKQNGQAIKLHRRATSAPCATIYSLSLSLGHVPKLTQRFFGHFINKDLQDGLSNRAPDIRVGILQRHLH